MVSNSRILLGMFFIVFSVGGLMSQSHAAEAQVSVVVDVPVLDADPYHRPYVAVWLETPERKPVATMAVWHEKDTWLKDMRQWWRKIGRKANAGATEPEYSLDGVSGATRKPGSYQVLWPNAAEQSLPPGEYLLNVEFSREEGGRSYIRKKIVIGQENTLSTAAKEEMGVVTVTTYGSGADMHTASSIGF